MFVSKLEIKNYAPFQNLTIDLSQTHNYRKLVVLVGASELVNQGVLQAIWETQENWQNTQFSRRESIPCHITFNNNISLVDYATPSDFAKASFFENAQEVNVQIPKSKSYPVFIYCNPSVDDLCSSQEQQAVFNSVSDFYKNATRYDKALDESLNSMLSEIEERLDQKGVDTAGLTFSEKLALIHSGTKRPPFAYPQFLETHDFKNFSLGFKEFLGILMQIDLFNQGQDHNVFLMVEPFAHARNSERCEMLQFVCNYINPRCQLWITTKNSNLSQAIEQYMPHDSLVFRFDSSIAWHNSAQVLKPSLATTTTK